MPQGRIYLMEINRMTSSRFQLFRGVCSLADVDLLFNDIMIQKKGPPSRMDVHRSRCCVDNIQMQINRT